MLHHVKRIAKKKSVIALCLMAIVPGAILIQKQASAEPTRYVGTAVTRGTLLTTVTGSGQVFGESQIDLKPNVSGAITKIFVQQGANVKKGDSLFLIDRRDAEKTVRDALASVADARLSVQSAELSLANVKAPVDAVSLLQAEHSVAQAERELDDLRNGADAGDISQAEHELEAQRENIKMSQDGVTPQVIRDAYDDTVVTLQTIARTLQQSLQDADEILGVDNLGQDDAYEKLLSALDSSRIPVARASYLVAKIAVLKAESDASALNPLNEDPATITHVSSEVMNALNVMAPFLQDMNAVLANTLTSSSFSQTSLETLKNAIQSARTDITSKFTTLTTQLQAIDKAKSTYTDSVLAVEKSGLALEKLKKGAEPKEIASAEERVAEAKASLEKVRRGADTNDIKSSENSLAQRRSALTQAFHRLSDAQETLADYTVVAPFDGVIARLSLAMSDQASPSTALATITTPSKIVTMSVNEVDVAKIHTQQKATLTFDAITDLSIAGVVSEVDSIGTVTQGVVNYTVKISLITQDDRIKTGMSASAAIVTDTVADALLVPNGAVTKLGGSSTVQILKDVDANAAQSAQGVVPSTPPEVQMIQTGLANDQMTVVTEGLQEGDLVVTRKIDPSSTTAAARTSQGGTGQNAVRIPGGTTGGFGATTFIRR